MFSSKEHKSPQPGDFDSPVFHPNQPKIRSCFRFKPSFPVPRIPPQTFSPQGSTRTFSPLPPPLHPYRASPPRRSRPRPPPQLHRAACGGQALRRWPHRERVSLRRAGQSGPVRTGWRAGLVVDPDGSEMAMGRGQQSI